MNSLTSPAALTPPPPLTAIPELDRQLASAGWAVLDRASLLRFADVRPEQLREWPSAWGDLPPDRYLRDGGRYRRRRHACFVCECDRVERSPHRAHWQPLDYNALHGGMERWFEPIDEALTAQAAWSSILRSLAGCCDRLRGPQRWHVEAHLFRIDTEGGIGRPTPEGAHRDGVDLVAVALVARHNVKGGETRVFDARGPQGVRFTLHEPFSVLLLDDQRVVHETTPIQPHDSTLPAYRDTLVITYRAGGFQQPGAAAT